MTMPEDAYAAAKRASDDDKRMRRLWKYYNKKGEPAPTDGGLETFHQLKLRFAKETPKDIRKTYGITDLSIPMPGATEPNEEYAKRIGTDRMRQMELIDELIDNEFNNMQGWSDD